MPTVNRSVPNRVPPPVKKAAPPSLLATAVDVTDLPDSPIHMLLWGKNGTGKTTLACQFPKPLLLVSVEYSQTGGVNSVKKMAGVKHLRLKTVSEVLQVGKELQSDKEFASVVFDSGTSFEEIVLAEVCGWDEPAKMIAVGKDRPGSKVTMDQYTERSERMRKYLEPYVTLYDKHFVLICNEKDHNPRKDGEDARKSVIVKERSVTDESFFGPAMGGGTARWCMDACDWICQLFIDKEVVTKRIEKMVGKEKKVFESQIETGKIVRRLRLKYHTNFAARVRCPDPDNLPDCIDAPTFEKIERAFKGELTDANG